MIQLSIRNALEITLCDPSIPMVRETVVCFGFAKSLSICIFVYDRIARSPFLENGGCNPWLEYKPTSKIDTCDD